MPGDFVLIAAFSGRALAQSARRAGYEPLVVDCFGDDDMRQAACASICLPARVQTGFRRQPLLAALEKLEGEAARPPVGLVLGSGFECDPRMVDVLAERFHLIGNPPDVIRRTKDPVQFFSALDRLGIRHPETQLAPPEQSDAWLMKRIGGSGGLHIHNCPAKPRPDKRRYFQRKFAGEAISLLGVVGPQSNAFALSRQQLAPLPRRPYRYRGAVSVMTIDADLEARLVEAAVVVSHELSLVGLISLDFLVADGEPFLIEVNPRPGATLDVFDDAEGSLFRAHVLASEGDDAASHLAAQWRPAPAKAAAFLYADRGPVEIGAVDWPSWVSDRPKAGSRIAKHQPIATVLAEAASADAAESLCRERLGELENMLYEGEK